jgi:hypothetical protein
MTAHSIDDHEQRRIFGHCHGHAILIVGPTTQQADFGVFDAQGGGASSDKLPRSLLHAAALNPRSSNQ